MNGAQRFQSVRLAKHLAGFSLIELVVVIVILSLLAVIGSEFVVSSTQSYQQTRTRALLANTGRQALERMSRQLRGALPYSVRLTNNGMCVEFMPIAGGGNYLSTLPDSANGAPASATIAVSPHSEEFGTALWVSIGALASGEIYGPGVSAQGLSARSANSLTLSGTKTWQRNSINRRFYLLDNPQAFCVVGTQLRFYPNQNMASASVDLGSSFHLLANSVNAPAPFSLTQGSENRNTIVQMNIAFESGGETLGFQQQVMIRNVP